MSIYICVHVHIFQNKFQKQIFQNKSMYPHMQLYITLSDPKTRLAPCPYMLLFILYFP